MHADLSVDSRNYELPVVGATVGADGILVSSMRNDDFVILDPGFLTTAQCESKITLIDGKQGILRYRGYDIKDLTQNAWYLEVAYLLIFGQLPTQSELDNFVEGVLLNTVVGEDFHGYISSLPRNSKPISVLASSINALELFFPNSSAIDDEEQVRTAINHILAKIRTITALIMRRFNNEALFYPNSAEGFIADFMRLCFARPYEDYINNPDLVDALDKLLIIQADHEQNCSTSVVRIVGSANASLYASVAAGINALSGPLHGGANQAAFNQFVQIRDYIKQNHTTVCDYVEYAKREAKNGLKIMGLGHRVYKTYDPRAEIAKNSALKVLHSGVIKTTDRELFDIALELEEIVLADEYFTSRHLYPNLDYWTCLAYYAIGFNPEMFTPLFALSRTAGWIANWREMHSDPMTKIGRPRQVYSGAVYNEWVDINSR